MSAPDRRHTQSIKDLIDFYDLVGLHGLFLLSRLRPHLSADGFVPAHIALREQQLYSGHANSPWNRLVRVGVLSRDSASGEWRIGGAR
jgi:hypothetical protein